MKNKMYEIYTISLNSYFVASSTPFHAVGNYYRSDVLSWVGHFENVTSEECHLTWIYLWVSL